MMKLKGLVLGLAAIGIAISCAEAEEVSGPGMVGAGGSSATGGFGNLAGSGAQGAGNGGSGTGGANGGTPSVGGMSATGGASTSGAGGFSATGGTSTGGTSGGSAAVGGTTSTGGTSPTGGSPALGGTSAGGASTIGGASSGGAATGGSGGGGSCDTSPVNTCGSAEDLGRYCADASCFYLLGCPNSTWTSFDAWRGAHSAWFQVYMAECSSCTASILTRATLKVDPGTDYDLFLWGSCGDTVPLASSIAGAGETDRIDHSFLDTPLVDNDRVVWLEVRHVSGCGEWYFDILGSDCI